MKTCLAVWIAAALVSTVCASDCDACIDEKCYNKHRLPLSEDASQWLMDVNRNTNTLYVSNSKDKLTLCQLDTDLCNSTTKVLTILLYGFTVDQRTGDTYGRISDHWTHSIYKLDLVNNDTKKVVPDGANDIRFKGKLYYSGFDKGIFTYENGESRRIAGTKRYDVYTITVDKNDDIYFRAKHKSGFVIRKWSNGVVNRTVHWDDSYWVTLDKDENTVFIHKDSHAVYRESNGQLVRVGAINDSINQEERPLFDRDNNVIYRNSSNVFIHLKREKDVHCTISVRKNKIIITKTVLNIEKNNKNGNHSSTAAINVDDRSCSPDGTTEENDDLSPSQPATENTTISTPGGSTTNPTIT